MKKQLGFTLIEVMIVIIIVGILASIAAPSLSTLMKNNRLKAQMFDMLGSINIARSEAVKRKAQTVLCRSADPTADSPTCGGTSQTWTSGWIVYAKGDDVIDAYDSTTDTIIGIGNPAEADVEVMSNSVVPSAADPSDGDNYIIYNTDGTLNGSAQLVYAICDDRGEEFGKQISIALVGRAVLTSGPIADCTP